MCTFHIETEDRDLERLRHEAETWQTGDMERKRRKTESDRESMTTATAHLETGTHILTVAIVTEP